MRTAGGVYNKIGQQRGGGNCGVGFHISRDLAGGQREVKRPSDAFGGGGGGGGKGNVRKGRKGLLPRS